MTSAASPDMLKPSRGFSLPLPHYDMSDTEPAAFSVTPPTYVLFPMDGEIPLSTSPVSLVLVPPGFAPIGPPGSPATPPVAADMLPQDFALPGSQVCCSPRDRCC